MRSRREWGQSHAQLLSRDTQGYVEGLRYALSPVNAQYSIRLLQECLCLDASIASQAYSIACAPGGFSPDAQLDPRGLKGILDLRAEIEGQWGGIAPAPSKYTKLSYYDDALSSAEPYLR